MQLSKHYNVLSSLLIALGLELISIAPASATPAYKITNLGALGGGSSYARGINNLGQVVGLSQKTNSGEDGAFLWQNGTMQNLNIGHDFPVASSINDNGQIVGHYQVDTTNIGFIWENGNIQNVQHAEIYNYNLDINNSGQVAGFSDHAFIWQNGQMQDLETDFNTIDPLIDGYSSSSAMGINNAGHVVGSRNGLNYNNEYKQYGYLWADGKLQDLGKLPGAIGSASPWEVNDLDQVVGFADSPGRSAHDNHAFLWDNGNIKDLGTLGGITSRAWAINNHSQVVGYSDTTEFNVNGEPQRHPFLWENDTLYDLNSLISANLGWELEGAFDINDKGQIVGYGYIGGETRAFLITPVPEPASIALLAFGILGLPVLRKK